MRYLSSSGSAGSAARHHGAMLTRSAILATTLAVGLVGVVGSSALAVAFVPGNQSGSTQDVPAIAVADQDPAEGTSSAFLAGVPAIVPITAPIALDAPDEDAGRRRRTGRRDSATDTAPRRPSAAPRRRSRRRRRRATATGTPATELRQRQRATADKANEGQGQRKSKAKEDKAKKTRPRKTRPRRTKKTRPRKTRPRRQGQGRQGQGRQGQEGQEERRGRGRRGRVTSPQATSEGGK